jgi:hypothetical protein
MKMTARHAQTPLAYRLPAGEQITLHGGMENISYPSMGDCHAAKQEQRNEICHVYLRSANSEATADDFSPKKPTLIQASNQQRQRPPSRRQHC